MKKQFGILSIVIIMIITQSSYAQYKLNCGALGNGCAESNNSAHKITGLAGQILIGSTGNSQYGSHSGLWHPIVYITPIESFDDLLSIPKKFELKQNYPNPFNPNTAISYQLPAHSHVELAVYNLLGQKVATLVNKEQQAGYYSLTFNSNNLASGVYVYKIKAGKFNAVRKMILMK